MQENLISFATAQRMKELGFVPPPIEDGQFWYNSNGRLIQIRIIDNNQKAYHYELDEWIEQPSYLSLTGSMAFYIPSAIEILAHLPAHFNPNFSNNKNALLPVENRHITGNEEPAIDVEHYANLYIKQQESRVGGEVELP